MMRKVKNCFVICMIGAAFALNTSCEVDEKYGDYDSQFLSINSVTAGDMVTKAVVEGSAIPSDYAGQGLGLFLLNKDGSYYDGTGQKTSNIRYSDNGQGWMSDDPMPLSGTPGILYGYCPFDISAKDCHSIGIQSSLNGIDFMFAEPVQPVSSSERYASIVLKHALSRITLKFIKEGSYSGEGVLTALSIAGNSIGAEGTLDITDGSINAVPSRVSFELPSTKITDAGIYEECLLVPVAGNGDSRLEIKCVIDGKEFTGTVSGLEISQGVRSEIVIAIKNLGLSVVDVNSSDENGTVIVNMDDGRKLAVKVSENTYEHDILMKAYSSGPAVIIEALSKSGYPLSCSSPYGTDCILEKEQANGCWKFTLSGMTDGCTDVTLGYDVAGMARTDIPEKGYFKDVFLDAGVGLDNFRTTPGSNTMVSNTLPVLPQAYYDLYGKDNWMSDIEYIWTYASRDSTLMRSVMCGNEKDLNGALLYPDGEPRFKMMFVYGGKSSTHGAALGPDGLHNVETFYANGGCYVSSCAGTFLSAPYWGSSPAKYSFNLLDGGTVQTSGMNLSSGPYYNDVTLEPHNRFLELCGFTSGEVIDSLRHNGGCMLDEKLCPDGTEVLARFTSQPYPLENLEKTSSKTKCLDKPVIWAYKRSPSAGRLVVCGSHPELCNTPDVTSLYRGELLYAMEGFGCATVKAALENGKTRVMDLHEGDPGHCGIGDGQYHHFAIFLPAGASSLTLELEWNGKSRLDLGANHGSFAFLDEISNEYKAESPAENAFVEPSLVLNFKDVPSGMWYVSVHCADMPVSEVKKITPTYNLGGYFEYRGTEEQMNALNGIPYSITATWTN